LHGLLLACQPGQDAFAHLCTAFFKGILHVFLSIHARGRHGDGEKVLHAATLFAIHFS